MTAPKPTGAEIPADVRALAEKIAREIKDDAGPYYTDPIIAGFMADRASRTTSPDFERGLQEGLERERERCARIGWEMAKNGATADQIAAAIRLDQTGGGE